MKDIKERFEQGYIVNGDCWEWQGDTDRIYNNGYDKVYRVSYILYKGKIPTNRSVRRTCGNKKCVNPEHLELVAHKGAGKSKDTNDMDTILSRVQRLCDCNRKEAYSYLVKGIVNGVKDKELFDIADLGRGLS
jgi:hypothetical protein